MILDIIPEEEKKIKARKNRCKVHPFQESWTKFKWAIKKKGKEKEPQFLIMVIEKPFSKTNKVEYFFNGIF